MKVIFTCGGTAGHINPALALAGYMQEREPHCEVLFVGAERGLERELIAHTPYPFRAVRISSLRRSFSAKDIRHNLIAVRDLLLVRRQAERILNEEKPDLIVGTGGYASYPMIRYGAARGIPTAVHESNSIPGLTTQQLEKYCARVMVGFEACRVHYRHPEKVVVTGTPVRGEFFAQTKAEARAALGITDERPLIVSFWGSLGAESMNLKMLDFLALEAKEEPFHHIHAVGSLYWNTMQSLLCRLHLTEQEHPSLQVCEYIYNMATAMVAADLVICRAGASTLSELTALGVPAILVPSPNVTNHHQEKNADLLASHGAALVLSEEELDGAGLFAAVSEILQNRDKCAEMSRNMASLGVQDATKRLYDCVMSLL